MAVTKKAFERERARLEILNYITSFCLTHTYGDGKKYGSLHGFVSTFASERAARVGDLVVLTSAPTTKWHISWLREIGSEGAGYPKYLLENIHDGALCWWTNVGLEYLERDELAAHTQWRWTDRQFAFKDRWWRVCFKEKDAYICLPLHPVFHDDGSVTLGTRTRFGFDEIRPERHFPDWRKVTKAQMGEAYDAMFSEREARVAEQRVEVASEPKAKSGRRDRSNGQVPGTQNPSPPGDPQ